MSDNTLTNIQRSYKNLDLFSTSGNSPDAFEADDDTTHEEDIQRDATPLNESIEMAELAQSAAFQTLVRDTWQAMIAGWSAKSENVKLPADERVANSTMALGLRKGLAAAGEMIGQAQERLKSATAAERAAMPSGALASISKLAAPENRYLTDKLSRLNRGETLSE